MSSSDYRYSQHTPDKQRDFEAAIDLHVKVTKVILRKYKNTLPYLYLDLFAGPGIDPDGKRGSPVVFLDTALFNQINYKAEFYEMNTDNALSLFNEVEQRKASKQHSTIYNADHNLVVAKHQEKKDFQYGAVYIDPSNAQIPFGILSHLCTVYPRLDIIINLACASYKRSVEHADYVPLDEMLPKMKQYWKIREPIGKHQWSIMIGTNWDKYPDLNPAEWRFHDIRSETGSNVYKSLVYTKRQLNTKSPQLPLWGEQNG